MRYTMILSVLILFAGCAATRSPTAGPAREALMNGYSTARVDFGIVVSDIDKAAQFYKNALGLVEVEGFDVPADMGRNSGLSDNQPFHVRVFKVADDENATQVKIMQFKGAPGKRVDNTFIHSSFGIRYLTFYVQDIAAAAERVRRAGGTVIANGPVELPKELAPGVFLAVVRDPDGNMVELVGPKKQ
ncbi:MAG TPA: VOC family protein [Phycisphaerae bacterium]|nr:VOC family protein [Phycisphaerae bacterium]HRR86148.1 VOC family protein [Phycisphaerae bacterium]